MEKLLFFFVDVKRETLVGLSLSVLISRFLSLSLFCLLADAFTFDITNDPSVSPPPSTATGLWLRYGSPPPSLTLSYSPTPSNTC